MGCTNSGPVKDAVTGKATELIKNGSGKGKIKKGVDATVNDVANLDFKKAQEDLEKVGEGLKETVQEGVDDLMGLKRSSPSGENETSTTSPATPAPADAFQPSSPTPVADDEVEVKENGEEVAEAQGDPTTEMQEDETEAAQENVTKEVQENAAIEMQEEAPAEMQEEAPPEMQEDNPPEMQEVAEAEEEEPDSVGTKSPVSVKEVEISEVTETEAVDPTSPVPDTTTTTDEAA